MATLYGYTARNAEGRFVAGSLRAQTAEQALAHLRTRTLFVTSLDEWGTLRGAAATVTALRAPARASRSTLVRSLAALLGAGIPLREALDVARETCGDARLAEALPSICAAVDSGSSLSAAMSRRPREFPELLCASVRAGELGGSLDRVLARLAAYYERDDAARKRLRATLTYPAIVTVAAFGLVAFLIADVVPAFAGLFAQMHASLPWTTRALFWLATAVRRDEAVLFGFGAVTAAVSAMLALRRNARIGAAGERALYAAPVLGALLRKSLVARFVRTLGTLLEAGVPMLAAMSASSDVAVSEVYRRRLSRIAETLNAGASVAEALEEASVFDGFLIALVRVGERSGTLDDMLLKAADHYEVEVEALSATFAAAVEPLIIVVLGAVIGSIVFSILIPLYSTIGSIH